MHCEVFNEYHELLFKMNQRRDRTRKVSWWRLGKWCLEQKISDWHFLSRGAKTKALVLVLVKQKTWLYWKHDEEQLIKKNCHLIYQFYIKNFLVSRRSKCLKILPETIQAHRRWLMIKIFNDIFKVDFVTAKIVILLETKYFIKIIRHVWYVCSPD